MQILYVGITLIVVAVAVLWWARRQRQHKTSRLVAAVLAAGLMLMGVVGVSVHIWALNATDTSQFARALLWGESSFGDQDRFPARTMAAAVDPVIFLPTENSPVASYVHSPSDISLEQILGSTDTTAFIVIHKNELLYEGYFNGSSHESVQTSFSVAKSFIATLVGIAIDEQLIDSLNEPLTRYVPELSDRDTRFNDITLRHLIVMSSGLSFDDGWSPWADPSNTYYGTDLRAAAIMRPRIEGPPGLVFDYNDWNVILLGLVLERATGMRVAEFMETRLWQPMGAEAEGSWSLDSSRNGFEKMFVGVNGRAIDFAKLGWLYLHEGRAGQRLVVPSDFVREATRLDTTTDPVSEYQYLWWIDERRSSYFANGDHGQFIYVDPQAEIVIVRHGRGAGDLDWIHFMGDLADWLQPQLSTD